MLTSTSWLLLVACCSFVINNNINAKCKINILIITGCLLFLAIHILFFVVVVVVVVVVREHTSCLTRLTCLSCLTCLTIITGCLLFLAIHIQIQFWWEAINTTNIAEVQQRVFVTVLPQQRQRQQQQQQQCVLLCVLECVILCFMWFLPPRGALWV